jgi:GNAT superfamily N-acetyltransferase
MIVNAHLFNGMLLGYAYALSDGAFSTILGELIVRPGAQRLDIGRSLIQRVEDECKHAANTS